MKRYLLIIAVLLTMAACDTDIENIDFNKPHVYSEEYFENLRDYKNSDHTMAFGWFGGWTADGPSMRSRLANVPDSMDIVSIWGNTYNLTPEKIADMRYVQKVKGTKVIFAIFAHNTTNVVPETVLENKVENIPAFARLLADSIYKYNYDGIDLDYEASSADLLYPEANMTFFIKELGKYIGPMSGTDKILCVDGLVNRLSAETEPYVSYLMEQTYSVSSDTGLDSRWSRVNSAYPVSKYFATEDFEMHSQTGGANYTMRDGTRTTSLMGFALWQPLSYEEDGIKKAGFGAYHFEYDYKNGDEGYLYMRNAIKAANPQGK